VCRFDVTCTGPRVDTFSSSADVIRQVSVPLVQTRATAPFPVRLSVLVEDSLVIYLTRNEPPPYRVTTPLDDRRLLHPRAPARLGALKPSALCFPFFSFPFTLEAVTNMGCLKTGKRPPLAAVLSSFYRLCHSRTRGWRLCSNWPPKARQHPRNFFFFLP